MSRLSFFVYSEDDEVRSRVSRTLSRTGHVDLVSAVSEPGVLEDILRTSQLCGLYIDLTERRESLLSVLERAPRPLPALILGGPTDDPDTLVRVLPLQPMAFFASNVLGDVPGLVDRIASSRAAAGKGAAPSHALLAVTGAKGGVGTTFVARELAAALQLLGERVIVVDLNLYRGDVAMHFDLKPQYTIADVAKKGGQLDRTFLGTAIATHISGVRVLASPTDLQERAIVSASLVERTLKMLTDDFDWVIVDLPHVWDEVALRALNLADIALLVTTTDVPSMIHAQLQLQTLARFGAPEESVRLIVNRQPRPPIAEADLRQGLGRAPDLCIPEDLALALRCINEGKLVHEQGRSGRLERAYNQLADLTFEWTGRQPSKPRSPASWLGRIRDSVVR
jgi:Flp pilus assembly CpaE family ATPase